MAFPNISDVLATTIEHRSKKIADNVTDGNVFLKKLSTKGKIRTFSGGHQIMEEMSFAENGNAGWYSGYDNLSTAQADVLTAATYDIKQAATAIVISGLERLQNSGSEGLIDLMEQRVRVGEQTMSNLIAAALYSDGTANGGKQLGGLDIAVPVAPTTGTYGGINRATWSFWQSKVESSVTLSASNIQQTMNTMWASLVRGRDMPDLILMDNLTWGMYVASLQALQRFASAEKGDLGFPSLQYMGTDVVLDGGIGGNATASTIYFLNCNYLHYRPHAQRNMVPLKPSTRVSTNQDAEIQLLAFAGNMTASGSQFQGRIVSA